MPTPTTTPLNEFLAAIAARQPTPGGGAVAAICGALAAAMGEMVLNYSVGRKNFPQFDPALRSALGELTHTRAIMLRLVEEDQAAYDAYTQTKKLADSDPQKIAASAMCIAVPQSIAATAVAILELAGRVIDQSNRWLLSDLAVCCELAVACVRSALHSVRVNLPSASPAERAKIEAACDAMLARAVAQVRVAVPRIQAILSLPG